MTFIENTFENILLQLSNIRLMDIVDIIVVAVLIYKLIPLLRNGSTLRIAWAILIVFVVGWVADILDMYTLSYLIKEFTTVGLIALVVLFQPELRRLLDHLGSMRLSNILSMERPRQEMDSVILQTVMACEHMSREKVGALIVFARSSPLDEYCKKGTNVDAQVSDKLLRNIFFPKAALHDGAMIVRDGRVAAAGCVLPLSEKRMSGDLGTRHRAAVGISEVSDAVAVVVSEETGNISVAVGGILKSPLAPQTLERLLRNELMPNEEEKDDKLTGMLKQKLRKNGKDDDKQ